MPPIWGRSLNRALPGSQVQAQLVLRRNLPGHAQRRVDGAERAVGHFLRRVRPVEPLGRIAGVQVVEDTGQAVGARRVAGVVEEPEPIFHDGPGVRQAELVQIQRLLRREHPGVLQLLREVAALHAAGHARVVGVVLERVAARLRDEVDDRAALLRLAEAAGRRHHDFLGGFELTVARHAAAVDGRAGAQAVNLALTLVAAAAAAAEHDHAGRQLDVRVAAAGYDHRRDEQHDPRIAARGRHRLQQVEIERPLLFRRLHVHDRALARNGDGFLEPADLELGVQRRDEIGRQDEPFALHGSESGERERDGVGARPQVDDAVLAGAVGDRRPGFLDQRRAGRFDGDAGKHRAGDILHVARKRRLGVRRSGQQQNDSRKNPRSRESQYLNELPSTASSGSVNVETKTASPSRCGHLTACL